MNNFNNNQSHYQSYYDTNANFKEKDVTDEREEKESDLLSKEQIAEKFLNSLEHNKKQVKSKTVSFKCTLEDYTMIKAKAILKNESISDFLISLAKKEKVKEYEDVKENDKFKEFKKLFE